MFEAWGRGLYRARRLTLVLAPAVRGGRRGVGNRRLQQAQRPATRSPRRTARATARPASRAACSAGTRPTSWCCSTARRAPSPTRPTGRRSRPYLGRPAGQRGDSRHHYWTSGQPAWSPPTGTRPTRSCSSPAARTRRRDRTPTKRSSMTSWPGGAGRRHHRQGRRHHGHRGRHQQRGQREHRPGRGDLVPRPAHPAGAHLRQRGGRRRAAHDRRPGDPRLVHRAAAAHADHHGPGLLGEHHHDHGPRPRHRLRPVHRHPVPRGTAPPADVSSAPSPGPWPPRAARSSSPASRSRSRCPA